MNLKAKVRTPNQHLFVVGAPRSGTTWLQLLLSKHPAVATAQETHFFSGYINAWVQLWNGEQSRTNGRKVGLSAILTNAQFDNLCRMAAQEVFAEFLKRKPNATVILEKTPVHIHYIPVIRQLFPQAQFVHLVRDPRSVVSSITAAAGSWGANWAPQNTAEAAYIWRDAVSKITDLGQHTPNLREIRYEDVKSNTVKELQQIFDWLGLQADNEFLERATAECSLERMKKADAAAMSQNTSLGISPEPAGFFRTGEAAGWQRELSQEKVLLVEYIAGTYLLNYGYTPANETLPTSAPLRMLPSYLVCRAKRWYRKR